MTSRRLVLPSLLALLALIATGCGRIEQLSADDALERLGVATSRVYDAEGNVIADLHGEINRDTVPLATVPEHVRNAVIAIEDERFWDHQGLDLRSITRAAVSNYRSDDGSTQGGSTISQQLAKQLYFERPERTLVRKIAEARVTFALEQDFTKSEILEMYLNTIYLGRGVYGFETAARSYFGKGVSDLTRSEGAFLAGVIHEPANYEFDPTDPAAQQEERSRAAIRRRNIVLERMRNLGYLSDEQATAAKAESLELKERSVQEWKHPYFVDLVMRQLGVLRSATSDRLDPRFDFLGTTRAERSDNVYSDGLRIYTTLDPRAQTAAEEAVNVLPADLTRLSVALTAIEPGNGYIRAIVGGRDYYPDCPEDAPAEALPTECLVPAKVNLALGEYGGGSGRQPGSSFKPFVLATALERGIPLHQQFSGAAFTQPIPGSAPWKVSNYEGEGGGVMDLVSATARSVNAVFARLEVDGVGEGDPLKGSAMVAPVARRLGIKFPTIDELKYTCGAEYEKQVGRCIAADNVPAIALGAKEVAPIDMASAYGTFANDGKRVEPTAIVKVTDGNGKVLYEAAPDSGQVLPVGVARGVQHALQQVVKGGTGTRAALAGRPAAGKTGTSQSWRDAWFAGFVPQLAAVIWIGNPLNATESMTPSNGYPRVITGGSYPAMIWHEFMTKALDGVPVMNFRAPPMALFRGGVPPTPDPSASPTIGPDDTPEAVGTVPGVIGMAFGEARSRLRAAGYDVSMSSSCDGGAERELHEVYEQSPGAGEQAEVGDTVRITYQRGGCRGG